MKPNVQKFYKSLLIILACLLGALLSSASIVATSEQIGYQNAVPGTGEFSQASLRQDVKAFQVKAENQQIGNGDRLVLGGTYTLDAGETMEGDLVIVGGNVTLKTGSKVEGDILVMGGALEADGLVEGDILTLGGKVDLGENAYVEGSVNMLGGSIQRQSGSHIEGEKNFSLPSPSFPTLPQYFHIPNINLGMSPLWKMFWILIKSFLWAAAAVLVTLFLPSPTHKIGQVISGQPVPSVGLGCLTILVAPILLIIIGITIIGAPISLLAGLMLLIAWCLGIIATGMEVGRRLASSFRQEWAIPVSASVGVFLLTIVMNSVNSVIPCVGWTLPFIVGLLGLGAVLLTRFGTSQYPSSPQGNRPPVDTLPAEAAPNLDV